MIRVTISAGVTGAAIGDRFDSLLLRADTALEQAKRGGRDRAVWHRPAGRRENAAMHSA
jgi:PleD family two-component response regulator